MKKYEALLKLLSRNMSFFPSPRHYSLPIDFSKEVKVDMFEWEDTSRTEVREHISHHCHLDGVQYSVWVDEDGWEMVATMNGETIVDATYGLTSQLGTFSSFEDIKAFIELNHQSIIAEYQRRQEFYRSLAR